MPDLIETRPPAKFLLSFAKMKLIIKKYVFNIYYIFIYNILLKTWLAGEAKLLASWRSPPPNIPPLPDTIFLRKKLLEGLAGGEGASWLALPGRALLSFAAPSNKGFGGEARKKEYIIFLKRSAGWRS